MEYRQFLQIPGPTNIPDRILRELSRPMINHRGPELKKLVAEVVEGLKEVFRTNNDILIFPSSGSGVLESAIANLFSPGDTVVCASIGVFSERMATIAERYKLNVKRIKKEWGKTITPEDVEEVLKKDKGKAIKAVIVPHNETTTGVTCDIEGISKVIKKMDHPALFIVDAVSSLAITKLETDAWNIDVVITASQKGLMLPPGMGLVSISPKGWEYYKESTMPRWYWDYKAVKDKIKANQFPYTQPTTLLFGLKEALNMLLEEGMEKVWKRHEVMAKAVRRSVRAMGLELLADEKDASNVVTAAKLPESINYKDLSDLLRKKYNVVIGGGLGQLEGKIFRIGHLGAISYLDVYAVMGAVEMALYELGYKLKLGEASKILAETFVNIVL